MAINQAYLFLIFSLNGLIIGLIFDFFRILRKSFKTKNYVTYIEDFLFWILTGISIILFMYKFSDGNLRLYMILGLGLGFILYVLLFSKMIIKTFVTIINLMKEIIQKILTIILIPMKILYKITNKFIITPLYLLFVKIYYNFTKKSKKIKIQSKFLQKFKKSAKN